jgi:hypothetical protein
MAYRAGVNVPRSSRAREKNDAQQTAFAPIITASVVPATSCPFALTRPDDGDSQHKAGHNGMADGQLTAANARMKRTGWMPRHKHCELRA